VIPPHSFVLGRPAQVTRAVTDGDLAWIRDSAAVYVGYARDFRTKSRRLDEPSGG
jgi:carbonic anhydrase/acetyltransferase-like protein (isoleucine patch superfamily)